MIATTDVAGKRKWLGRKEQTEPIGSKRGAESHRQDELDRFQDVELLQISASFRSSDEPVFKS